MIKIDCMPKKSKKEKIIATYHRKIKLINLQTPVALVEKSSSLKTELEIAPKKNFELDSKNDYKEDKIIKDFFFTDLKKTLFLIFSIIVLEFGLYFVSINNYLKK